MTTQKMNVQMYPDNRMNTKNAAIYLGLAEATLATMRCNGKGPAFVKRGRVYYFKDDLDNWIEEGRVRRDWN